MTNRHEEKTADQLKAAINILRNRHERVTHNRYKDPVIIKRIEFFRDLLKKRQLTDLLEGKP